MFNILLGAIVSSVLMFIFRLMRVIPDRWDWWFFFTAIIFFGRIMTICYKNTFSRYMKRALEIFDNEFDEEQKALLTAASGHIFPPRLYTISSFQVEPASISSYTCLGAIILLIASLFYEHYFVSCIALIIFLTGPKVWQPSFFYTGNYQMDVVSAVSLFLKKNGENIKALSELEQRVYISSFLSVRDKFYHLWDKKNGMA